MSASVTASEAEAGLTASGSSICNGPADPVQTFQGHSELLGSFGSSILEQAEFIFPAPFRVIEA